MANISQLRSEHNWAVVVTGFFVYALLFITGSFFNLSFLNIVGSLLLFCVLIIGNHNNPLTIKKDATIKIAFLILFFMALNTTINFINIDFNALIKYILFFLLYIVIFSYDFQPLYETDKRKHFIGIILLLLVLSFFFGKTFAINEDEDEVVRAAGLFVNPNNLSIMSFTLLYFINEKKSGIRTRLLLNSIVVFFLILSSTSGAILAFIVANIYKYNKVIFRKQYIFIGFIAIVLVLTGLFLMSYKNVWELLSTNRVVNQFIAIKECWPDIAASKPINYGHLFAEYSESDLTGLWRLEHWRNVFYFYTKSGFMGVLLGNGIGSSIKYFGILPHNDFLRVLFEQGLIIFILYFIFYYVIFKRIDRNYRYLLVLFATFSFSENIFGNFLFMSMLTFFIATSQYENQNKNG